MVSIYVLVVRIFKAHIFNWQELLFSIAKQEDILGLIEKKIGLALGEEKDGREGRVGFFIIIMGNRPPPLTMSRYVPKWEFTQKIHAEKNFRENFREILLHHPKGADFSTPNLRARRRTGTTSPEGGRFFDP